MATDPSSLKIISTWLVALSGLVPPTSAAPLTKARLATLTMQLGEVLPSGAFTSASMRAVAEGKEFFPGWMGLLDSVDRWWQSHRPKQANLLAGSGAADLDVTDSSWLRYWHEHRENRQERSDAIVAERQAAGRGYDPAQLPLALLASLVRGQSPRAWAIISGTTSVRRPEPTEYEIEAVRAATARAVREMHGIPAEPRRSHRIDEQLAAVHAAAAAAPLPPASAEVLRQRAASPAVQAAKAVIDW